MTDAAPPPAGNPLLPSDPTEQSVWGPWRILQTSMSADIGRLYAEAGIEGLKTSHVMELLRLAARGPMTITELAASVERTHSAMSQKVADMRRAGLVRTVPGPDARSKRVELTPKAREVIPKLAAEWRATEAAVAEIEAEIPYPLTQVVTDIEAALSRRSFHDRIATHLAADPDWTGDRTNTDPDHPTDPNHPTDPGHSTDPDHPRDPGHPTDPDGQRRRRAAASDRPQR